MMQSMPELRLVPSSSPPWKIRPNIPDKARRRFRFVEWMDCCCSWTEITLKMLDMKTIFFFLVGIPCYSIQEPDLVCLLQFP
ncbi:hypothetical protein RchiOBHm_Chr7g0235571 [Rosa chinensis]|uniref:Uncharacterized protein n=1 Tax=Rosa chinensis TaxID=74649 RepID=A0A2P6PGQ0_ROSCH|nr:hypothetical protein RchiOBHm_Chr7g0235571 [Rosa chinensis]